MPYPASVVALSALFSTFGILPSTSSLVYTSLLLALLPIAELRRSIASLLLPIRSDNSFNVSAVSGAPLTNAEIFSSTSVLV